MNSSVARLSLSRSVLEEIALEASTLVKALGMALDKGTEEKLAVIHSSTVSEKANSNVLLFDDIDGPLIFW